MAVEASIAHSTRKLNNAQKLQEQVSKEVEKQVTKLQGHQRDLETVQKAADEAQGEWQTHIRSSFSLTEPCNFVITENQRRASQNNLSLSERSLEEYRRLSVYFIFRLF